tara:strand:- start:227 stop:1030 length:804 start_codon:yes stop_codon:yes gene_type:complete
MSEEMKTCFVIMPISDQDGYEKGHFTRVYQHIIKPACEKAGFYAIRADDEIKTNYIVLDIIKKIIESEIVICDLSAKNPNVLYELGIRQAFNKKAVLIKDNKTNRIFDIQGLRTIDYDENLRIDEVQKGINNIAKTLKETYETKEEDVNSLIQLLSLKPAEISSSIEISKESSLIMESLNDISNRLSRLEKGNGNKGRVFPKKKNGIDVYDVNGWEVKIGTEFFKNGELIGKLIDLHPDSIFLEKDGKVFQIMRSDKLYSEIDLLPF